MAVNIFQTLRGSIAQNKTMHIAQRRAMYWFQDYATELSRWQRKARHYDYTKLAAEFPRKQVVTWPDVEPGYLYFYLYDPKLKNTLPYYDQFPFVLVLDKGVDSMLGLNFHYLDYFHRATLFDALYNLRERGYTDLKTHMRATYGLLKNAAKYKAYRPCIKRYLQRQVSTAFLQVGTREWDIALFMPVESFQKQTKTFVWSESNKKII